MISSLPELASKLNDVGNKSKKFVDRFYLFALFLFVAAQACSLTNNVAEYVSVILDISSLLLILVGIYRIVVELSRNWKKALLLIAVILFGFVYTLNVDSALPFSPVAFAIIGAYGVCADYVLFAGLAGNIVMIISNIVITLTAEPGLFINSYQDRDFFFLGDNVFYVSKWNNYSSTDFAAHYFWIIAVYLWIRSKKITWGEIFALAALDILVYSLTGSNTSFICIGLMLAAAILLKVKVLVDKRLEGNVGKKNAFTSVVAFVKRFLTFLARYSFLIIAVFCIVMSVIFNAANPVLSRINSVLNLRFSLGHRGIIENGIHLIAKDVPSYGMASSADEFYNFLDCSYISILVNCGLLLLIFYLVTMTVIQIRHRKYVYGLIILAVCALSCIEEHHLPELPYNLFVLLLFADIDTGKKTSAITDAKQVKRTRIINVASFLLCVAFFVTSVFINITRYRSVKELDRLDSKAASIYDAVQSNLTLMVDNGSWQIETSGMNSYQYGDVLSEPEDYEFVTGGLWKDAVKDPKSHSYFYLTYDSADNTGSADASELLIDDSVRDLIGNGSCVIEYDVVSGKVYSVWFTETKGCRAIKGGRTKDRSERLRDGVTLTGYYAGANND